jgi:hypothetical protein
MRIYRAPYNLFMISHGPLDKELKPIEDPSELLSSKGLSILGQLDSLENIDKDDIYDYFNDGCVRNKIEKTQLFPSLIFLTQVFEIVARTLADVDFW